MGMIERLTPKNLATERKAFFADQTYNPQFEYSIASTPEERTHWGLPKDALAEFCVKMLEHIQAVQPFRQKLVMVTPADIQQKITEFNQRYKLAVPVQVQFSAELLTQCRINDNLLEFKLPIIYSPDQFAGVYRHELETHFLRRYNHQLQPWDHQTQFEHFRHTEEGLAGLHTNIFTTRFMRKTFRTYYATWLAQRYSFVDTFKKLQAHGISEKMAWLHTARAKRGMMDTALPGGQTKDISYLEGCLQVWQWLQDSSHDPRDLYLGRIALSDIEKLKPTSVKNGLLYPSFFDDMKIYKQEIDAVGERNHFPEALKALYAK